MTRSPEGGPGAEGGPSDHDIQRVLDAERRRAAATARRHAHWLGEQAAHAGTLKGTLTDLAEHEATVVVLTAAGGALTGVVAAVGSDVVSLRSPDATVYLVAIDAIMSVHPGPDVPPSRGDRGESPDLLRAVSASLRDVLQALSADRATVTLTAARGPAVRGVVTAAGHDVVCLTQPGGQVAYVPLAAVCSVAVR